MNAGPFEIVADGDRDNDVYGRQLRHINRNGQSLGDILIDEGLAAAWEGQHHAWC
jgi:endonuclease YncB( thermonuclease family)